MGQQLPVRHRRTDVLLRERPAPLIEDDGALLEAARGERNVRRDHDVVAGDMLDDPVVGGVEALSHDDQLEPVPLRDPDARVRHHGHAETVPPRHAVDLLLHRAAVRVDEDVEHSLGPPAGLAGTILPRIPHGDDESRTRIQWPTLGASSWTRRKVSEYSRLSFWSPHR